MNIDRILLIIIIIYLIFSHLKKNKNIENFALSVDDKNEVINLIRPTIKEIYNTDMEAVRQLANMAAKLNTPSGLTIDGNLTVTGTITGTKTIVGSITGNAATATSADSATSATSADSAGTAGTAGSAGSASSAYHAVNNTTFTIGNNSSSGSDYLKYPTNPNNRNGDVALVVKPLLNATKIRPYTQVCSPTIVGHVSGNAIGVSGSCSEYVMGGEGWYGAKSVAFFEGAIQCNHIYIGSDERIKQNITEITDGTSSLELFRKIKCSKYEYIDKIQHSSYKVHGFIAQDLINVIPECVTLVSDYLPSFYCMCSIEKYDNNKEDNNNNKEDNNNNKEDNNNNTFRVYISSNETKKLIFTGNHDVKTNIEYKTVNGMPASDEYGNQFFKIKLKDELDNDIEVFTTKIIDEYSFLITVPLDNDKIKEGRYFLYGQLVDNFHKIDNDHIHNITTTALKEVDKQQQIDKEKIKKLEDKVLEQQLIINNILERLNKLELK